MASVASFFVSRVDTEADKRLDEIGGHDELKGTLAIANAKLAYETYKEVFAGERWEALRAKGASAQRCLWASTSTKNPEYRDVIYVEELIGRDTVNTMPRETVEAFQDHGEVADTLRARRRGRPAHAAGLRRRGHRLRRRGGDARARGRGEVRQVVRPAVRRRRGQARRDGAGMSAERRRELGQQLRVDSVRSSAAAGSGHPTSSMSAADLMAVLLDGGYLRHGHAGPGQPGERPPDLLQGPRLAALLRGAQGGGDHRRRGAADVPQARLAPRGPPHAAHPAHGRGDGLARARACRSRSAWRWPGKRLDRLPYRVWCLCGDSEMAEGSMWEAFEHAAFAGLDNLTAIIDVNRLGQTRETMVGWDLDTLQARAPRRSAGTPSRSTATTWRRSTPPTREAVGDDGPADGDHRPDEEGQGRRRRSRTCPTSTASRSTSPRRRSRSSAGSATCPVRLAAPEAGEPHRFEVDRRRACRRWELGEEVATRQAYGEALTALGGRRGDVVALDGEVSNSTHSEMFRKAHEDRYFEMFIAENQLVAAAVGMQVRGWVPFASTFAAFLSRAYDFVRMAAISRADIRLSGSHAGVSIGEDGPSQMALEDIASFRAIHGSTVLHPSDANQAAQLVEAMAERTGISFIRTLRGKTEVRTPPDEDVRIGGSRVVREGDDVAIVACGITVDQAVEAAETLAEDGIAGPRARLLLDQADRRRGRPRRGARVRRARHRGGPLAGGRAGRRGARGAGRGRRPPAGAQAGRARDADVGQARRAAAPGRHRRRGHRRRRAGAGAREGRVPAAAAPAGASSTGANRSPCSATRASTSSALKASASGSRLRARPPPPPSDRGGDRRALAARSEYTQTGRLVLVVLAPVDEHLARRAGLGHLGHDELRVRGARAPGRAPCANVLRLLVGGRRVERHVELHALGAGGLRERLAGRSGRTRRAAGSATSAHSTMVAGGPGSRSKASIVGACGVVGAAPAAYAAPGRRGWPARRASAGPRRGSSDVAPVVARLAPARCAPSPAGGSGTASRRRTARRRRSGSA